MADMNLARTKPDLNDCDAYDSRSARNYGASWTAAAPVWCILQLQEHIVENTWYNKKKKNLNDKLFHKIFII